MNTAELHVEQVLIGALMLGTALLPWLPELSRWVGPWTGARPPVELLHESPLESHPQSLVPLERLAQRVGEPIEDDADEIRGTEPRLGRCLRSWPRTPGGAFPAPIGAISDWPASRAPRQPPRRHALPATHPGKRQARAEFDNAA